MLTLAYSLSSSSSILPYRNKHQVHSLNSHRSAHLSRSTSLHLFNPLRSFVESRGKLGMKQRWNRGYGPVCYSPPVTTTNLQWICTISSAGEYGIWTAFLALLVRLFFYIPGELELPFIALLLVIVSPYQITNIRGRQEGVVLSLVIAAFMAFQHFTRVGNLRSAFDQGSIIATLAILCIVAVPCLLLI